jgi:hypothetical protein
MLNIMQSRMRSMPALQLSKSGQHILGSPANVKSFEIINIGNGFALTFRQVGFEKSSWIC